MGYFVTLRRFHQIAGNTVLQEPVDNPFQLSDQGSAVLSPRERRIGITEACIRKRDAVEAGGERFSFGSQGEQVASVAVERVGKNHTGCEVWIVVSRKSISHCSHSILEIRIDFKVVAFMGCNWIVGPGGSPRRGIGSNRRLTVARATVGSISPQ